MQSHYRSSKLAHTKKVRLYIRLGLAVIVIGGIVLGLSFLSYRMWNIDEIFVEGTEFSSQDNIKNISEEILNKKGLLSSRNYFLIPKGRIVQKIKESESAIKDVSISISDFKKMTISITEYDVIAKWCLDENFGSSSAKCFLLNDEGKIIIEEPEMFLESVLIVKGKKDGDRNNYADKEVFSDILKFEELLKQIEISTVEVSTDDYETFSFLTSYGTKIIVDKFDDPNEVANNLNTAIKKEAISKAQLSNIDYVDLRFGNKVYYKIK